jgi:hypothetical protein
MEGGRGGRKEGRRDGSYRMCKWDAFASWVGESGRSLVRK